MLARRIERRQRGADVGGRRGQSIAQRVERQRRRPAERRAHQRHRAEHVGPDQRTVGGNHRAEIVADHGCNRCDAERGEQPQDVAHQIERAERPQVGVIAIVRSGGAPIAALVRRDHMEAGRRQHRHYPPPAEGEFREAVQQHDHRPPFALESGLQHMHGEAVDVVEQTRADAGWKQGFEAWCRRSHWGHAG